MVQYTIQKFRDFNSNMNSKIIKCLLLHSKLDISSSVVKIFLTSKGSGSQTLLYIRTIKGWFLYKCQHQEYPLGRHRYSFMAQVDSKNAPIFENHLMRGFFFSEYSLYFTKLCSMNSYFM